MLCQDQVDPDQVLPDQARCGERAGVVLDGWLERVLDAPDRVLRVDLALTLDEVLDVLELFCSVLEEELDLIVRQIRIPGQHGGDEAAHDRRRLGAARGEEVPAVHDRATSNGSSSTVNRCRQATARAQAGRRTLARSVCHRWTTMPGDTRRASRKNRLPERRKLPASLHRSGPSTAMSSTIDGNPYRPSPIGPPLPFESGTTGGARSAPCAQYRNDRWWPLRIAEVSPQLPVLARSIDHASRPTIWRPPRQVQLCFSSSSSMELTGRGCGGLHCGFLGRSDCVLASRVSRALPAVTVALGHARGSWVAMVYRMHAWQPVEGASVCAHDCASGSGGGCGDDEVVSAAGSTCSAHGDEQGRVVVGDCFVVRQDRDRGSDLIDVRLAAWPLARRCELDPNSEFGEGDRRDRNVVIVTDEFVEVIGTSLGIDEERGVEK